MDIHDFELLKNINLYEILNINNIQDFSKDILKKNYKKLVLKFHPDRSQTNETKDKFESIQLAYIILSNDDYRNKYNENYDTNNKINNFCDLKNNFSLEKIDTIDENEFKKKIKDLNNNNPELEIILNKEQLLEKINNLLIERDKQDKIVQYDETLKNKEKFNEEFEKEIICENQNDEHLDLIYYETKINKYGSLNNYNTMYSEENEYDLYFKINKIKKQINEKTIQDKMKEYENETNVLKNLTKFNKSI